MKLVFDNFPVTWNIITLPVDVLVKSETDLDLSTGKPCFFSSYANTANKTYTLKSGTKLVDIRTLKYLVLETMLELQYKNLRKYDNLKDGFTSFMNAYGLMKHEDQVNYVNSFISEDLNKYTDIDNNKSKPYPMENIGSRISYRPVDEKACAFLASLFNDIIDGYISPDLPIPFHTGKFNHEICLFNRSKCVKTANQVEYTMDAEYNLSEFIMMCNNVKYAGVKYSDLPVCVAGGADNASKSPGNVGNSLGNASKSPGNAGNSPGNANSGNSATTDVVNGIFLIVKLGNVWNKLENQIEIPSLTQNSFQCSLAKNIVLQKFMANIVIDVTKILYHSFNIVIPTNTNKEQHIINTIKYHYRPLIHVDVVNAGKCAGKTTSKVFILKPGLSNLKNELISQIVNNDAKAIDTLCKSYSLNEMMGAVYGVITHAGMFSLIFQGCASLDYAEYNAEYKKSAEYTKSAEYLSKLKERFNKVSKFLSELFGVGESIDLKKELVYLLKTNNLVTEQLCSFQDCEDVNVYEVNKGNLRNIILDMIIANTDDSTNISIVRKNLNNQEYIRVRTQKNVKQTYSKTSVAPSCPRFYPSSNTELTSISDQSFIMVDGDEWYTVNANGFFQYIMKKNGRVSKAGPSGSTFMWMNMLFGLMGKETSDTNLKQLLLCIVSDFVPVYHSLTEVLLVFSRELNSYNGPDRKTKLYNIDQNPVEWLAQYILGDGFRKEEITNIEQINSKVKSYIESTQNPRIGGRAKKYLVAHAPKNQKLKPKTKKK